MMFLTFLVDWLRRFGIQFSTRLPHVATYTRELPVSLERMYENAIDGEHLPWLHQDTFASMTVLDQGAWGWRARGHFRPASFMTWLELELRLDRDRNRWITRTLRGLGKGTEVITHAIPLGEDRIRVIVDFYVPKLPRFLHGLYARQFIETYTRLYDEDLWMMSTRQRALDRVGRKRPAGGAEEVALGDLAQVRRSLPLAFEMGGSAYRVVDIDGELVAHATTCPHMLGPLDDAAVEQGQVRCPWHGYRFEVKSGDCTSGQRCRLPPAPAIIVDEVSRAVIARSP